jgi:hypothetical protein
MAPFSESGHNKNAASFGGLVNIVSNLGAQYNPSFGEIQLSQLQKMDAQLDALVAELNLVERANKQAIANRKDAFAGMSKLTTKLINLLVAFGAAETTLKSARSLVNLISGNTGKRKTKDADESLQPLDASVSKSRMSFDNRKDNFAKLVILLKNEPNYNPNESAYKVSTLEDYLQKLDTCTDSVQQTETQLRTKRDQRDALLYTEGYSAYDLFTKTKAYLKAVFGQNSSVYKQVSGLSFVKAAR